MIGKILLFASAFALALVLTLIFTPLVREMNRALGMIDKPDPRRINKVPIPRGGGLALALGLLITSSVFLWILDEGAFLVSHATFLKLMALSAAIVAVGYADDKFSLPPVVKLLGQIAVAAMTWFWTGLGFSDIWPSLPPILDGVLTIFWIIGAINAFNLIDGLDGLASGLALIATIGMGSCLAIVGPADGTLFYCIFAGALAGFLRYNYNPASVFLGDSGSMLIGFVLSVLPLCSHTSNSFLVSVGVPLLAMGVPIFDTSLAIFRRSIRHLLRREGEAAGNDRVMTADTDHLHHRILRAVGLDQRKAAWSLYALALFLVTVGLVGVMLRSHAAGLWLLALVVAVVIAFRDMARVELLDVGLLLDHVAHPNRSASPRGLFKFAVPILLSCDFAILCFTYVGCCWILKIPLESHYIKTGLIIRVSVTFGFLALFHAYETIWSRAVISNFLRLFLACCFGSFAGSLVALYAPSAHSTTIKAMTILYALLAFVLLSSIRIVRPVVRDLFYILNARRLVGRKDISRVLVYGTGLRYRSFRRELVRSTASNKSLIVGLIDDNILLRHNYIGGCQVKGTLEEAPEIINALNVDTVVIAFAATEERLREICAKLEPCHVKVILFSYVQKQLLGD